MESAVLKERHNFVVLGNTVNEEKYAYKIKMALLDNGYDVISVPGDVESINDVSFPIDLLDFCINPVRGLDLLMECRKDISFAVLQPGASSADIRQELTRRGIPFTEGCLLRELEKEGRYSFEDSHNR